MTHATVECPANYMPKVRRGPPQAALGDLRLYTGHCRILDMSDGTTGASRGPLKRRLLKGKRVAQLRIAWSCDGDEVSQGAESESGNELFARSCPVRVIGMHEECAYDLEMLRVGNDAKETVGSWL